MLLALDTSSRWMGVALYDGEEVRGEVVWHSPDYHTVQLAATIQEMLGRAGLSVEMLKAVAVASGPGSYTGLRVGVSLAKGLVLACGLPLIAIPTLDILAAAQPVPASAAGDVPLMAAVLLVGRGRLAVGWYQALAIRGRLRWRMHGAAQILSIEDFIQRINETSNTTLVTGELPSEVRRSIEKRSIVGSPAQNLRRPSYLAELAWQRWQMGKVDDPLALTPFYLRTEAIQ